jgi:hypothetical protein
MTMHCTANVCRLNADMAVGSIVPTDETYERLDESRPVIDFFLTSEQRWKASRFYDPKTGDRGMVPPCFSPGQEVYYALDVAWVKSLDDKNMLGTHKFEMED